MESNTWLFHFSVRVSAGPRVHATWRTVQLIEPTQTCTVVTHSDRRSGAIAPKRCAPVEFEALAKQTLEAFLTTEAQQLAERCAAELTEELDRAARYYARAAERSSEEERTQLAEEWTVFRSALLRANTVQTEARLIASERFAAHTP